MEVRTEDAFDIPADLLVFGRTKPLKRQIEEKAGKAFEPWAFARHQRRASILESDRLPWQRAISLGYHPRNVNPGKSIMEGSHTINLTLSLSQFIDRIAYTFKPKRIVILPLSCRNPDVVAIAMVTAIWRYAYHQRYWQRNRGITSPLMTFVLADLYDTSHFVRIIENRDGYYDDILSKWGMYDKPYSAAYPFRSPDDPAVLFGNLNDQVFGHLSREKGGTWDGEFESEIQGWKIPVHVEAGDAGPTEAQRRLLQDFREREKDLEGLIQMAVREYYRKNFRRLTEERRQLLERLEMLDYPDEWLRPYHELPDAYWTLGFDCVRIPESSDGGIQSKLSLIFNTSWQDQPLEVRLSDWRVESVDACRSVD